MGTLTPQLGRVLVVDDEVELLTAVEEALTAHGYESAGVTSGRIALEALQTREFDLLLTDLMMPGMDGIALLRAGLAIDPYLVGIVMTGQGTVPTAVEAMKVGAFDYLLKPFRLDDVWPVLARAMEVRRLRLENIHLRETVAIYNLSQVIAFSLDTRLIVDKTVDAAAQQVDADEVSLMLVTPAGDGLYVAAVRGEGRDGLLGQRVPFQQGVAGWVARQSEPLILNGEIHDPRFKPVRPRADIRSAISMPLFAAGQLVGVLNVNSLRQRRPFTLGQVKALSILTSTAASALHSAALYEESERLRHYNAGIIETMAEGLTLEDARGQITYANARLLTLLGYAADELIGQPWHKIVARLEHARVAEQSSQNSPGQANTYESILVAKDGREIPVLISAAQFDQGGQPAGILATFADLTERKQAEAALAQTNDLLSRAEQIGHIGSWGWDIAADRVVWSDGLYRIFGLALQEFGATYEAYLERVHPDDRELVRQAVDTACRDHGTLEFENRIVLSDGRTRVLDSRAEVVRDDHGKPARLLGIGIDITERKQAEVALAQANDLLSRAEQVGHIGSWDIDLATNRELWSDGLYRLLGLRPQASEPTSEAYLERIHPDDRERVRLAIERGILDNEPAEYECRIVLPDGESRVIYARTETVLDHQDRPIRKMGIGIDITERKQAEAAVAASEAELRALFAAMTDVVLVLDQQGRYLLIAPTNPKLLYRPAADLLGRTIHEALPSADADTILTHIRRALDEQQPVKAEYQLGIDGVPVWFDATVSPLGEDKVIWIARDITDRIQHERELEAIAAVSTALRAASTRAEMTPVILDQLLDLLHASGSALDVFDALTGEAVIESARGVWSPIAGQRIPPGQGIMGQVVSNGRAYVNDDVQGDPRFLPAALAQDIRAAACVPLIAQKRVIGGLWVGRPAPITSDETRLLTAVAEIAANAIYRASLYEQTEQRLQKLAALREIDIAISSHLDLRVTLDVLLAQVMSQLRVDAASVLLLDPHSRVLEYAASRGLRARPGEHFSLHLGQCYAGRVALDRRRLSLADLALEPPDPSRDSLLNFQGLRAYHGVPLIAMGQVKGVLEVFHRVPQAPDADWLDFLEALAGQAAIAIDNTQLFDELQRSNLDLGLAYEATIEGWSRALDLRDKETEGHSRRVTELTLALGRALRIWDDELVHIRRGALLHDIGKMGVPDSILLKPGPLTEDEWVVMKKHPTFAYEMLAPIHYLRSALDIPYCHHEKWDGTGYPRGLKGDAIPLAARIFAVVDVWDALRSDRPYRVAWPEAEALEYIRAQAGQHFDPDVVAAFVQLMNGIEAEGSNP